MDTSQQLYCTVRKAGPSNQVTNSSDFQLANGLQRVSKIYKCPLNTAQCRIGSSNLTSFYFQNLYRKNWLKCSNKVLLAWLGKCLSYWSVAKAWRHPDRSSRTCSISQQYLKGMVFIADGGRKTARGNSLQGYFNYATDCFCCICLTTEVPDSKQSEKLAGKFLTSLTIIYNCFSMSSNTLVLGAVPSVRRSAIKVGISISICTKTSVLGLLHVVISRKGFHIALLPESLAGMRKGVRRGRKALWRWSQWKIHLWKRNICWELMIMGGLHLFSLSSSLKVSGFYTVHIGPRGCWSVGQSADEALKMPSEWNVTSHS